MAKQIIPNLRKLAEMTCNPNLKMPNLDEEVKQEEIRDIPNLQGFIYVPPINLYVAKQRDYAGLTWFDTHKQLHSKNLYMPTIPQFIAFINYLKGDYRKLGKKEKQEAEQILDDILTVRSPWRVEWLDAKFEERNKQLYIHYNHRTVNGELKPQNSEKLEKCLMDDKLPGINLEHWLNNPTKQGLPKLDNPDGKLHYWYPRDNCIARFYAVSFWAGLYCNRGPFYSLPSLGVFAVSRAKILDGDENKK